MKKKDNFPTLPTFLLKMGYKNDGRRLGVDPDIHLMRSYGNSPAIDSEVIAIWSARNIKEISVHILDGTILKCQLSFFLEHARIIDYRHGQQLVMPRSMWSEKNH